MSRKNFRNDELLQVGALRNSKVGEELFVEYGEKFVFYKVNKSHFFEDSRVRKREIEVYC